MKSTLFHASKWKPYGFTLIVVLAMFALRLVLAPVLGAKYPYVTLFPAVVLSALWGGFGPGMLALALSFGMAWYLGFTAGSALLFATKPDLTAMIINFIAGTFVCFIAASMRRTKAELRRQQSHLEEVVEQRTRQLGQSNELLRREVEKRSEAELRMRAASVAKDNFIAALSHELRTPLNPVLLLASEGATNPRLPIEVRHDFDVIAKNVRLEARLIDDLLDITRITQGKLLVDLQLVEADKVLREALAKVKDEIETKAIRLEVTLDPSNPMVRGDPARLQQVFWNVLKNAAKFTPQAGEIKVSTAIKDRQLVVVVADNGIGMTPEELRRIFAPFEQGDHATEGNAREFSGLGLGLSIARTMISHHSGTIEGASAGRDRGAVFTITLPLAEQTAAEVAAPVAAPPTTPSAVPFEPPSRILLVEDDVSSRTALARLLTRRNYEVVCAGSGAEALAAATQQKFAFVISDIGLPEQDGYSLMKQLRQRHGLRGIALTGYGTRDDIASSETAGFVAHLTKPVSISTLERAIEELKQENAKFSHIEGS